MASRFVSLTPDTFTPASYNCWRLRIPDNLLFQAAFMNVLSQLAEPYNWEQFGTMPAEQCAELALSVYNDMRETGQFCMLGAIFPYATALPPNNCLACDGAIYNRADYPQLYALLDSAFIIDADTFSVPMLQGYVVMGADADIPGYGELTPGLSGGEYNHTLTLDEMPAHNHTQAPHSHGVVTAVSTVINGGLEAPAASATPSIGTTGSATPSISTVGGSEAHNNVQPFVALRYCMVAK